MLHTPQGSVNVLITSADVQDLALGAMVHDRAEDLKFIKKRSELKVTASHEPALPSSTPAFLPMWLKSGSNHRVVEREPDKKHSAGHRRPR